MRVDAVVEPLEEPIERERRQDEFFPGCFLRMDVHGMSPVEVGFTPPSVAPGLVDRPCHLTERPKHEGTKMSQVRTNAPGY